MDAVLRFLRVAGFFLVAIVFLTRIAPWLEGGIERAPVRRPPPDVARPAQPSAPAWTPGSAVSTGPDFVDQFGRVPAVVRFDESKRRPGASASGTAFALTEDGVWMTAKHVVDDCAAIYVLRRFDGRPTAPPLPVERATTHPRADVAVLFSRKPEQRLRPFPLGADDERAKEAFHVGFPHGEPGAIHSTYLGRTIVRHSRRDRDGERLNVWAEQSRVPNWSGDAAGISGGVALDAAGRLIGVTVAGNARRGRLMTSIPATIRQAIDGSGVRLTGGGRGEAIDAATYPAVAYQLFTSHRIAQVACLNESAARRWRGRR